MIKFEVDQQQKNLCGIYRIIDSKSGRVYVGSASRGFAKRFSYHVYRLVRGDHPNRTLQAIFSKDATRLSFHMAEVVQDLESIIAREQWHIDNELRRRTRRHLINELLTAGTHLGRKRGAETRRKLSEAMRGRKPSEQTREKQRLAKLGRKLSDEHRRKLSEVRTGKRCNRPKGVLAVWCRKYTPDQVREFRRMKESGLSYSQIREATGISHGALQKIVSRQTYADVE